VFCGINEALTAHWFLEEIVHPVFAEIGKKSLVSCKTHGYPGSRGLFLLFSLRRGEEK
jgi:hypothetical protein